MCGVVIQIFRLDPKVKALEAVDKEPATSTMEELTPLDKVVKQRQITDMWGTKKEIERVYSDSCLSNSFACCAKQRRSPELRMGV